LIFGFLIEGILISGALSPGILPLGSFRVGRRKPCFLIFGNLNLSPLMRLLATVALLNHDTSPTVPRYPRKPHRAYKFVMSGLDVEVGVAVGTVPDGH